MIKSDNKTLNICVFETIKVSDFYRPKKKFIVEKVIFPLVKDIWNFQLMPVIDNNFSLAPPAVNFNTFTFKITA